MTSPAFDIATQLQQASFGTIGTDLFVGSEPSSPSFVTTIYDTGGGESRLSINGSTPTIQVRTRSTSYTQGYQKQIDAKTILQSLSHFTANGYDYNFVMLQSDIGKIGISESGAHIFTSNYRIERKIP